MPLQVVAEGERLAVMMNEVDKTLLQPRKEPQRARVYLSPQDWDFDPNLQLNAQNGTDTCPNLQLKAQNGMDAWRMGWMRGPVLKL